MVRVRACAEVVIEEGTEPGSVIHAPVTPRRFISECIELAKKHKEEMGTVPTLDAEFAGEVEEIVSRRTTWNPSPWD